MLGSASLTARMDDYAQKNGMGLSDESPPEGHTFPLPESSRA